MCSRSPDLHFLSSFLVSFFHCYFFFVPSFSPFIIIQKGRNSKIFHCCSCLALYFRLQVLVSFFSSSFPKVMTAQKVRNITAVPRLHSTFRLSIFVSFLSSSLCVPSVHGCSELEKRQDNPTSILFLHSTLVSQSSFFSFLPPSLPYIHYCSGWEKRQDIPLFFPSCTLLFICQSSFLSFPPPSCLLH